LTYSEISLGGGLWQYDYSAVNGLDPVVKANFNLYDILFQFPSAPSVLALPDGWDYVQIVNSIESFSTVVGPPPDGTDIPPGQSLSGFSFQLTNQVGSIPFTFSFSNPTNPGQPLVFSGTATPATTPEPASLMLVIAGTCFLVRSKIWRGATK
jgi:hypothetical protein